MTTTRVTSDEKASGKRQRKAALTRARVVAAARREFASHGYTATTIEGIAKASGVPVQTIYSAFGSKPAIVEEVRRAWIRQSDVAALHAEALQLHDPRDRLARAAHWTRRQFELGLDVILVYQEGARLDPRVAQRWQTALTGREMAIAQLIGPLSAHLRSGLSVRRAVDLYVALTLPEIYRALVHERQWTVQQYEAWLATALGLELLG